MRRNVRPEEPGRGRLPPGTSGRAPLALAAAEALGEPAEAVSEAAADGWPLAVAPGSGAALGLPDAWAPAAAEPGAVLAAVTAGAPACVVSVAGVFPRIDTK